MSLCDIEKKWVVSKILITENANPNYLAYKLGMWGIYAHRIRSITTDLNKSTAQLPMLVETRSPQELAPQLFVLGEKQFKAYKIFKHGEHFYGEKDCIGLVANTMKNMLHLFEKPTTFYIDSNSNGLRKQFYDMGVRINTEDETGHSFDYENYDYSLIIKKYDTYLKDTVPPYDGSSIFTCLTGKNMPNYWNQNT